MEKLTITNFAQTLKKMNLENGFNMPPDFLDVHIRSFKPIVNDLNFYTLYAKECRTKILDLGVGTARIACCLANKNFKIIGIDNSIEILGKAKENINKLNPSKRENLNLLCADMRNFYLEELFQLAYLGSYTFMLFIYPETQITVLKNIYRQLDDKGILIFSTFSPICFGLVGDNTEKYVEREFNYRRKENIKFRELAYVCLNKKTRILTINEEVRKIKLASNSVEQYDFKYNLLINNRSSINNLIKKAGFNLIDIYNGYNNHGNKDCGVNVWILQK